MNDPEKQGSVSTSVPGAGVNVPSPGVGTPSTPIAAILAAVVLSPVAYFVLALGLLMLHTRLGLPNLFAARASWIVLALVFLPVVAAFFSRRFPRHGWRWGLWVNTVVLVIVVVAVLRVSGGPLEVVLALLGSLVGAALFVAPACLVALLVARRGR